MSLCVCVCVCLFIASQISETSEAIAITLVDTVTASVMKIHHVSFFGALRNEVIQQYASSVFQEAM